MDETTVAWLAESLFIVGTLMCAAGIIAFLFSWARHSRRGDALTEYVTYVEKAQRLGIAVTAEDSINDIDYKIRMYHRDQLYRETVED